LAIAMATNRTLVYPGYRKPDRPTFSQPGVYYMQIPFGMSYEAFSQVPNARPGTGYAIRLQIGEDCENDDVLCSKHDSLAWHQMLNGPVDQSPQPPVNVREQLSGLDRQEVLQHLNGSYDSCDILALDRTFFSYVFTDLSELLTVHCAIQYGAEYEEIANAFLRSYQKRKQRDTVRASATNKNKDQDQTSAKANTTTAVTVGASLSYLLVHVRRSDFPAWCVDHNLQGLPLSSCRQTNDMIIADVKAVLQGLRQQQQVTLETPDIDCIYVMTDADDLDRQYIADGVGLSLIPPISSKLPPNADPQQIMAYTVAESYIAVQASFFLGNYVSSFSQQIVLDRMCRQQKHDNGHANQRVGTSRTTNRAQSKIQTAAKQSYAWLGHVTCDSASNQVGSCLGRNHGK
jgi:hypothetical protein